MSDSRLSGSGSTVVFVFIILALPFIVTSSSSFSRLCGGYLWFVHWVWAGHGCDGRADLGDLGGLEDCVRLLEHVSVGGGVEGHGADVGPHGQGKLETPQTVHGFCTATTFKLFRLVTDVCDEGLSKLTWEAH